MAAGYLLVGQGYTVLKAWKKRRGKLFSRRILRGIGARFRDNTHAQARPQAIVPIPQKLKRSWDINGSPAYEIAQALGRDLKIPVVQALRSNELRSSGPRQAELKLRERIANPIHFDLNITADSLGGTRVLIVDDFMTTGRTLMEARRALESAGLRETTAFCLGFRPGGLRVLSDIRNIHTG